MAAEMLPLVHVCADSVGTTWPLVLEAVDKADMVALDLELSGLGLGGRGYVSSLEEHYKLFREAADSHSVLCVGVACFKWAWSDKCLQCHVEVFNVWLLCQREYVMDPKAAKFLLRHGFDFNRQISKGLPYTPAPCEALDLSSPSIHSLLGRLLLAKKPLVLHNGWVDLLFLFHTFYCPLPPSVDAFMADLADLFLGEGAGGVFDTKAVAEYEFRENASFLEYIFRKRQRDNTLQQAKGLPHLVLQVKDYPFLCDPFTERVSLTPTPPSPGVLSVRLCSTFANYGFCNSAQCSSSHDVMVVLAQEDKQAEVQRLKRKRVRERREEGRKKRKEEGKSCHAEGNHDPGQPLSDKDDQAPLMELFQTELDTAKVRLGSSSPVHDPVRPSFGHRAGFDAFMTGYAFSCYALHLAKSTDLHPPTLTSTLLSGVSHLRGCLGNRGKDFPLRIARSHFAKPSKSYQAMWEKITGTGTSLP